MRRVTEGKIPLSAYADNDSFKVYMMDTGLLCSKFGIAANVILSGPHTFDGFKGALAENYICQNLAANGFTPFYWSSPGKAEISVTIINISLKSLKCETVYLLLKKIFRTFVAKVQLS